MVLATILGGAAIVWLALEILIPSPPKKITIATGQRNQIYQAIGISYRTVLARSGVDVDVRLNAMYRRLRRIEARLQHDVTAADVSALEADLDGVDRAIHSLAVPMRYSDVYFSVKSRLDLFRTRIKSRRAEMAAR